MYHKVALFVLTIIFCKVLPAQKTTSVSSPDGQLVFELSLKQNGPNYSVKYKGQLLIAESLLKIKMEDSDPFAACKMIRTPVVTNGTESYLLVVGKTSHVQESYKKGVFFFEGSGYQINLEVKVFNDGLGFRYVFPKQKQKKIFTLTEEQTQFKFVGDPIIKALPLPNFTTSHEGFYITTPVSKIKEDTLLDMPALFQFPNKMFLAVTEAALLDYAGMYLINRNDIISSQLSPLPGQEQIKVKAKFPHQSPWRVMLISDRIGALIESNIITNLNEPLAIKDVSWIQTGTTTFPWWNGTIIPDSVKGGNNFETNQYYIDFCAANNIKYHSVVEYGGHEWYTNDGEGYQPGKNFDVTQPVDGLDMKQICDYAKSKGVGIRVWVHWKALYPKLDTALALFEQWGLSGMMIDFMDRDDQEMVNIQTEMLQKAAKHRLHIQFHGAYKPTGLHRMYPNEFTREGVMNYEYDKWEKFMTPDKDLDIPFTRMLAGSTDYHLGGFRALPVSKFIVQDKKPYVMGTRCHMLAMYVVLENYQGMVCDYPDAYIGEPGFEVLQNMPTIWDETVVPNAEVGQFISIARRKQDSWYVGTITGSIGREITINLKFLSPGKYTAEIYSDAADASENMDHLTKKTMLVDSSTLLKLVLVSGGGNVIVIKKLKNP